MEAVLKSVLVRAILLGLALGGLEFFEILREAENTYRDAIVEGGYTFFFTLVGRGFVEGGIDMVRAATNSRAAPI